MVQIKELQNGIKVLLDNQKGSHSLAIGIGVDVGANHETEDERGFAHFLEHMMFKGFDDITSIQMNKDLENTGFNANAWTSSDSTFYHIAGLPAFAVDAIDILNKMFCRSSFIDEEFEIERSVVLEEFGYRKDHNMSDLYDKSMATLVEGPYSLPVLGTKESISNVTNKELFAFMEKHYTSDNIVLSIAGKITADTEKELLSKLNEGIGKIERRGSNKDFIPEFKLKAGKHIFEKDTEKSLIIVSYNGVRNFSDKYILAGLVDTMLGGCMSSIMMKRIREELGLAYSAGSFTGDLKFGDISFISAMTSPDKEDECVEAIKNLVKDLKVEMTPELLSIAKRIFLTSIEASKDLPRRLIKINYQNYMEDGLNNDEVSMVLDTTIDDIHNFVDEHMNVDKLGICILRPTSQSNTTK